MPPEPHEIEERIAKASHVIDNDPYLRGTKAAKQFGALYEYLMARRCGRPPSYSQGRQNKKLSVLQDDTLKEYILILQYSGRRANIYEIRIAIGRLLFWSSGDSNSLVLIRWTKV
jgi:hypothetical protein